LAKLSLTHPTQVNLTHPTQVNLTHPTQNNMGSKGTFICKISKNYSLLNLRVILEAFEDQWFCLFQFAFFAVLISVFLPHFAFLRFISLNIKSTFTHIFRWR
jgi:hypothetical protein